MNNSSPLKKNGLFTSPILGLYDKPRQLIVATYTGPSRLISFFQQVQTQITTAYCRIIPTLDPVVAPKEAGGLHAALLSGSASPPPPRPSGKISTFVGEN